MFFLKQLLTSNKEIFLIVFCCVLIGAGTYLYQRGYSSGSKYVQNQWDRDKDKIKIQMLELQAQYNLEKEQFVNEKEDELRELKKKMAEQEEILASANAAYADKLQQSEDRSAIYQRKAASTEAERRSLAAHTARLDKALTEGIRLVEELAGTLKLRDEQLKYIGKYLKDTYALLGK